MWDDLANELDRLRDLNRYRSLSVYRNEGVRLIDADGHSLLNFGANDYLGLASYLAKAVTANETIGATASSLVCGWTQRHQCLADTLAKFEETESAVLFPSGFAACSGTISALGRAGDLILSDQLNHASLIDGCRMARAECVVYPHGDTGFIENFLSQHRLNYKRAWIVSDSVFSMDGDLAPLQALCDVAEQFDATMIVDEAHATGVLGQSGSGACEELHVKGRVPIRIGTLSKALGGQGGFVVGPTVVTEYLINRSRPLVFSTALSLPAVETALLAIENVKTDPDRRSRVRAHASWVREQLGMTVSAGVPIIPIHIGSDSDALKMANKLRNAGLFVPAIRPPTVPENGSRLRVSLSASHQESMLVELVEAINGSSI